MTCREARRSLERGEMGKALFGKDEGLARHLAVCDRCREVSRVARLSEAIFGTLRGDLEPGPMFYARLRARLAGTAIDRADTGLLQAWEFARRLIPAVAFGVILLAGLTMFSGRSPLSSSLQAGSATEFQAFPADVLTPSAGRERPSRDWILAFALAPDDPRHPAFEGAGGRAAD